MLKFRKAKSAVLLIVAIPIWSCSIAQSPVADLGEVKPASTHEKSSEAQDDLLIHQYGLFDYGKWIAPEQQTSYPDDWRSTYMDYARASVDLALNNHEAARQNIEESLKINPDLDYLYTRLAMAHYMANKPQLAMEALERGLARRPGSLEIMTLKARILEDQQNMTAAITVFEDIVTSHPNHVDTLSNLAEAYFRTNQKRERTKDLCRHILELDGRHYTALILLGTMETIDGNMEEAVGYLERALRRRRWEPWRVLNIARIMERNRRTAEAAQIYTLLMEYYPDNEEIRKRWEEMVVQRSGEDGLITAYEDLIKKNPSSEALYTTYAQYLIRNNLFEKALEIYKQLQYIQPDNLYIKLLAGFEALKMGDVAAAQENFNEYLGAGGDEAASTPYIQVAMFYSQFGHDDKAIETIESALTLFTNPDPPLLLTLADLKEKTKDFQAAEEIYFQLSEANPNIAAYKAMLGQCYQLQGKLQEALKAFIEAQTKAMPSPRYLMDAVLLALDLGLNEQAEALVQTVMDAQQDDDSHMRVALMAATAFDQYGLNDLTEKWADKALDIAPNNQAARNLMIFAEVKRSRSFEVLNAYPEFIAQVKDKNDALGHQVNLGRLLIMANRPQEAVDALMAAQKEGVDKALLATYLAPALAQTGREKEAVETLEWIDPVKNPNARLTTQADVLKQLKKFNEAEEVLLKYLQNNPLSLDAYVQLGALYQDMKAYEEAEEIYNRALGLFPYDYNLLNNYGYMLAVRGIRLDEAEEKIRFALRLNPGAGYILDSLAWVEFKRGFYDKAIELLDIAWKRSLPEAEIAVHIAETYEMLNKRELTREFYEKALKLDPANSAAREGLKKIE